MDDVVIPYICKHTDLNASFTSTTDDPTIWVNIQGYDPAGTQYTIFNRTIVASSPSEPEPEPEPEEESESPGGIPGFSF